MNYPLAKNGVFRTIQGEGPMLGIAMTFIRLAGCSIGCHGCDTDYAVSERATEIEIAARIKTIGRPAWIWITGGEPTDHDLRPLIDATWGLGRIAVATAGSRQYDFSRVDFVSVSPHGKPSDLMVRNGSSINLVPGLNGLSLCDWAAFSPSGFGSAWVTPGWNDGRMEGISECLAFVAENPWWRMGIQAHKSWGVA